jgi:RNA polymerase sigma factor (sigma-70 family)
MTDDATNRERSAKDDADCSDAELLRSYVEEGSEAAFAQFVDRHLPLVYSAALRRTDGDPHRAAEVAQFVFTDAAQRARQVARHAMVGGWLHLATRNAALNLLRSEARRRSREQTAHAMSEANASAQPTADWEQLRPVIDSAIDDLDEADREAVVARFFQDQSFAGIGAKLHLTENAARMRVERALEKLRGKLTRRGVTSTATAVGLALANQAGIAAPAGLAASVSGAALTAAAASGSAGAWAAILTMSKIKTGIVSAIVISCLATAVVEVRANRALRAELRPISGRDEENRVARLQVENQRLSALVKKAGEKNPEITELTRVQNRIAALKARPPGVVDEEMRPPRNLGRATPAAAIETFCWSIDQGDLDLAASFMAFTDDSEETRAAFMANFSPAVRERYRTPERLCAAAFFGVGLEMPNRQPAMQVVSVEEHDGPDEVRIKIWWRTPAGKESGGGSTLRRRADGWAEKPFALTKPGLVDDVRKRIDLVTGDFINPANANR